MEELSAWNIVIASIYWDFKKTSFSSLFFNITRIFLSIFFLKALEKSLFLFSNLLFANLNHLKRKKEKEENNSF
jgi:hypothetical protein